MGKLPPFRVAPAPLPAGSEKDYAESAARWCQDYHFAIREVEKYLHGFEDLETTPATTAISDLVGSDGIPGPEGPQGPEGPVGQQGNRGQEGNPGKDATEVLIGAPGEDGTVWYERPSGDLPSNFTDKDWAKWTNYGLLYNRKGPVDVTGPRGDDAPVSLCVRTVPVSQAEVLSGITVVVPFSVSVLQVNGNFAGVNASVITVPNTGVYRIGCTLFGNGTDNMLYKEVSVFAAYGANPPLSVARNTAKHPTIGFYQNCSGMAYLNAGSTISVQFKYVNPRVGDSGVTFDPSMSRLWAVYLGG